MKKILICSLLMAGIALLGVQSSSAQVSVRISNGYPAHRSYPVYQGYGYTGNLPPGQAKKLYGMKSARYLAHERGREKFYGHRRDDRHYYNGDDDDQGYGYDRHRDDDQGDEYYRVPRRRIYVVPVAQPGVVINAHVWIP